MPRLRLVLLPALLAHLAAAVRIPPPNRTDGGASYVERRSECGNWLIVKYTVTEGANVGQTLTYYFDKWQDLEVLAKSLAGSDNCEETFVGMCAEEAMVVRRACNKPAAEVAESRCLGGVFCLGATLRGTSVGPGERMALQVPGLAPDSKQPGTLEVTSGYVNYWTSAPVIARAWLPTEHDMLEVVAWAKELAVGRGPDAVREAALSIRQDSTNGRMATETLAKLAAAARDAADGVNATAQMLHHLHMLHFEERKKFLAAKTAPQVIRQLAADYRKVRKLQAMSADQLAKVDLVKVGQFGLDGLARFHQGLASRRAEASERQAPRALLFSCSFGGGHASAAMAVADYLRAGGYQVDVVDTTYDPEFKDWTVQSWAGFFNNFIIKRQMYALHNVLDWIQQLAGQLRGPCPSPGCNSPRKHQFRAAILRRRPDLLVTVYHMELLPVLEVAKDLGNLPLLHIATDVDIKMAEVFSAKGPGTIYPRFLAGVPFDVKRSWETVPPLDRSRTFLSGYPVRPEFLEPVDEAQVAEARAALVPPGVKVLLVMTGGGGQDVPWPYKLATEGIGQKLHVVVVAGHNPAVVADLRKALPVDVRFPGNRTVWQGGDKDVTVEVARDPTNTSQEAPFELPAARLALLMDVADAILTKPGGGTTAEAAYRGVPAVFDASVTLFHWEQMTVQVFEEEGRGLRFGREADMRDTLRRAMALPRSRKMASDSSGAVLNTGERILAATRRLLNTSCVRCSIFP